MSHDELIFRNFKLNFYLMYSHCFKSFPFPVSQLEIRTKSLITQLDGDKKRKTMHTEGSLVT